MNRREEALEYHSQGRPGKIEVVPTKPVASQRDLSLAYTPGVAEPCREIDKDQEAVAKYTARRNLVAVVTNGTAVLGLGDIGPYAAKPVMEGKAVLFKRYADIDVFDIEIAEKDPQKLIDIVCALEPTFGGINLEDIKAPECFVIERALRERMKIPVFHDDQHGTAIITTAALKNAALIQQKKLETLQIVCVGAGASAIACMELWVKLGVQRENVLLIDSKGVVTRGRAAPLDEFKERFARPAGEKRTSLAEALEGADVLVGLSSGGKVDPALLSRMAKNPIIFALANPDPEVSYDDARKARPDAVVATGRSDFPNQVNNVLGFPFVFRGALDVGATRVNDEMKLAAAHAIADLAREGVPEHVVEAYGGEPLEFGPHYIIPKPVDARVLYWVAPAVAKAALESGVARDKVDLAQYRASLERQVSPARKVLWEVMSAASKEPKRIVFPEGTEDKILRAAEIVAENGIARPVLIGDAAVIRARAEALKIELAKIEVIDPRESDKRAAYAEALFAKRQRKGLTRADADRKMARSATYFGMMMVQMGDADGLVSGLTKSYGETIRPALEVIGVREGVGRAAGMYIAITKNEVKFLADTTINIEPDAQTVAETAILAADVVTDMGLEPRIAMLSFSNFGDAPHPSSRKMAHAAEIVRSKRPELVVDGEMQADVALDPDARAPYPFSTMRGSANVLVFPSLDAGNIACRLLAASTRSEIIGPIVLGLRKPVNVLQRGSTVDAIVHVAALTAAAARPRD